MNKRIFLAIALLSAAVHMEAADVALVEVVEVVQPVPSVVQQVRSFVASTGAAAVALPGAMLTSWSQEPIVKFIGNAVSNVTGGTLNVIKTGFTTTTSFVTGLPSNTAAFVQANKYTLSALVGAGALYWYLNTPEDAKDTNN